MSWVDGEPSRDDVKSSFDDLFAELKGVKENATKRKGRKKLDHKRKGAKNRSSPVTDYIRSLGDYKSTGEVAEILGKSEGWVRKAAAKRWTQAPSFVAPFGDTHVNLYTDEDVEALREYIEANHKIYKREDFPFEEK